MGAACTGAMECNGDRKEKSDLVGPHCGTNFTVFTLVTRNMAGRNEQWVLPIGIVLGGVVSLLRIVRLGAYQRKPRPKDGPEHRESRLRRSGSHERQGPEDRRTRNKRGPDTVKIIVVCLCAFAQV